MRGLLRAWVLGVADSAAVEPRMLHHHCESVKVGQGRGLLCRLSLKSWTLKTYWGETAIRSQVGAVGSSSTQLVEHRFETGLFKSNLIPTNGRLQEWPKT
jgi:hypothetical protein